jgi:hypothetical protein
MAAVHANTPANARGPPAMAAILMAEYLFVPATWRFVVAFQNDPRKGRAQVRTFPENDATSSCICCRSFVKR